MHPYLINKHYRKRAVPDKNTLLGFYAFTEIVKKL
jgi:hypothetical protein